PGDAGPAARRHQRPAPSRAGAFRRGPSLEPGRNARRRGGVAGRVAPGTVTPPPGTSASARSRGASSSASASSPGPPTRRPRRMDDRKAMTVNLTEREMATLEELSRKKVLNKTAILLQALRLYQVIDARLANGEKLFFEDESARRRSGVLVL